MATRLYLPATAAAVPFSPTPDANWENTASVFRARSRTFSGGSTLATVAFTDANNADQDVLIAQFVTRPLTTGQTITGAQALKTQVRCIEVSTNNNLFLTVGIRVINMITGSVNKTVLAVTRDAVEVDATTLTNRQFTATSAATNYTTVEGDCLVIEIGLAGDPAGSNTHSGSLRLGNSGASDLSEDDTSTVDNNPWVQLTDTLTFTWTIATGSGSYTQTGTAVKLEFGHKVPVGSGSYTQTGTAVGLKRGYPLSASSGSYLLSGSDVALTYVGSGAPAPVFQYKRVSFRRRYGIDGRRSRSRVQTITKIVPLVIAGPSAGSATLAIGSGNYSLSGSNIGLTDQHKLPVGSGIYTIIGSNVGLERGYPLTVGSGSYTLVGSNVALTEQHKIPTGSGSYLVTGTSVGLKRGYPLAVGSGAYTLTGSTVGLIHKSVLSVGSGTYTLTGSTVGLKRGYPIAVQSGTYTLTGTNVGLEFGHKIPIGSGVYLLSGSTVGLKRGYPIAVGSGSYTITGSSITFVHDWVEQIDSGLYTLHGTDVDLRYSAAQPSLSVGPGSYLLSGSSVGLIHKSTLTIGSGSYAITGSTIALKVAHNLPINSGSYLLTGSNVTLQLANHYTINIDSGVYSYIGAGGISNLLTNLEGYYRFDANLNDETSNSRTLDDLVPIANIGSGGGALSDGWLGDGSVGRSGESIPFSDLSFIFYIKFGGPSAIQSVIQKVTSNSGDLLSCLCSRSTTSINVTPLGGIAVSISGLSLNVWHYIEVICQSGVMSLYIDDVLIGTSTAPSPDTIIGWQFNALNRIAFDQPAIWSRALSNTERAILTLLIDPTTYIRLTWGHSIIVTSGIYHLTGSNVTLTYTPIHLPGGLVCATIYIIPSVIGSSTIMPILGSPTIMPTVQGSAELERC